MSAIALDPLIAEAKRRARRRKLGLMLVLLAAVTGLGVYLSQPNGSGGGGGGVKAASLPSSISVPAVVGRGSIQTPPASALASQTLSAMSFPAVRIGYLVIDGHLSRTSDGGRTWRGVGKLPASYLDFVTPSFGLAVTRGRLLETVDGGAHWRSLRRFGWQAGGPFAGTVDFVDRERGWVATPHGRVYRTVDGGSSWTTLPTPQCFSFGGLSFVDSRTGFAVCGGQPATIESPKDVYETNDGGSTWRHIAATRMPWLKSSRADRHLPDVPINGYADGLLFRNAHEGLMSADRAGIYLTRNRAHTWSTPLFTGDGGPIVAMSWPSSRVLYALLWGNTLLRSTDGARHWHRVYPVAHATPAYNTLAAVSRQAVVAVGASLYGQPPGLVVGTNDGGRTWAMRTSLPGNVQQITRGDGSVWAVTNTSKPDSLVFRSRDAGRTWTRVAIPPHLGILGLDVAPDGSLVLSPEWGGVYRSADDGRSWQTIRRQGKQLGPVQFVSAQQGFAIDGPRFGAIQSSLVQTLDGGKTWHKVSTVGLNPEDIYVLDARHWWLWAYSSCRVRVIVPARKFRGKVVFPGKRECAGPVHEFMLRTSDGGASWTAFHMPDILTTPGYSFVTPQLGYATGTDGILRTTDGGQDWRWIGAR